MSYALPQNWIECSLDELLISLESGSRPKGGVRGIAKGIPSIGGEHLNYSGRFNFSNIKYVPEAFAERMSKGQIQPNDILIVKDGATTGKTAFVDSTFPFKQAFVNEHVFICRPSKKINPKFLFWYLWSKDGQDRILENFKGSAQGGINQTFTPNTTVPLAPLAEQERIVAKLDALMTKLDVTRARLDKIPQILNRFRQSVLSTAVNGQLTDNWRKNNQQKRKSIIDLIKLEREIISNKTPSKKKISFEVLQQTDGLFDVPSEWTWLTLVSLCNPSRSLTYGVIKLGIDYLDGIPCLRTSDVKTLNIITDNVKRISKAIADQYERTYLQGGELLINVRGTLGGVAFVPEALRGYNVSREVAVVPILQCVNGKYVSFFIASMEVQNFLKGIEKGVAYTGINIEDLTKLPIALPPIEEQHEIVLRVEKLFGIADEIESRYKKAKAFIDKLPQSILAKAFRGELTQQDPNDEPASVLLERIRKEKESLQANVSKKIASMKKKKLGSHG